MPRTDATVSEPARRSAGWQGLLLASAVAVAGCLLYWPVTAALAQRWNDSADTTYSHGFLIAAVSAWLLWRERDRLTVSAPRSWPQLLRDCAPLLALGGLWLVCHRAAIGIAGMLLLPAIIWAGIRVASGPRAARSAAFPLGFLIFAIPVWSVVNPLAQWSTVYIVRGALRVVGIPAYFYGNYVQIPSGTFVIADGCSGLHFLIVALALGALLGELQRDSWRSRAKLLMLSVAFAALVNWVRVFGVILAGHLTYMQHYLVQVDHRLFGWVLFVLGLPLYFWLARRLQSGRPEARPLQTSVERGSAGGSPALALTFLALAIPVALNQTIRPATLPAARTLLPTPPAQWSGPAVADSGWKPVLGGADVAVAGQYTKGPDKLEVFVAHYREQRQGRELGAHHNDLAGGGERIAARRTEASGRRFNQLHVRFDPDGEYLIWYGYAVGDRWHIDPRRAQLDYALRALGTFRSPASRVVAVASRCAPDCAAAENTLREFTAVVSDELTFGGNGQD